MSLESLHVRDFAIIHRNDLEIGDGLTVVTGETGAGKSIMIDALDLVLGARADSEVIRHGAGMTEILASFSLQPSDGASRWLAERELADAGGCVLRRLVHRDKPTRAYINDRPVTVQTLRELGEQLVDIHGQHEHQSLLAGHTQRRILDDYAGHATEVAELAALYDEHQALGERLQALLGAASDRESRLALHGFQLEELEALDLKGDEFAELEREHQRLAHASELQEGMRHAADSLYDADDGAINARLAQLTQRLESLTTWEPGLADALALLHNARVEVDEAAGQLHHLLGGAELDPQRLEWLAERIGTITDLARKHRCEPGELPAVAERLRASVAELEDHDANLTALREQIDATRRRYDALAARLSRARRAAAARLAQAVTGHMQALGMAGGALHVAVETTPGAPARHGRDSIEFQVAASGGTPARSLSKVASGGELSRISLAIQVVLAQLGRVPTLVFDEVDVGIGGRVAEIVGQQLRLIGATRQVLCITHLPQVAAQGHRHLHVLKADGQPPRVEVRPLDAEARIEETARMLGGIEITSQTRAHARDMLRRAARDPSSSPQAEHSGS